MRDLLVEHHRGGFTLSTDRAKLDLDGVLAFLRQTYWAAGMPRDMLERAVENSICIGVYDDANGRQVGFARVVTDLATYGYLSDVFIIDEYRGRGLGKWMVECIVEHPELRDLRRLALFTRDAQGLYEPFGFRPASGGSTYLEKRQVKSAQTVR